MADVKYVVSVDSTGATKSIETLDQAFKKLSGDQEELGTTAETTGSKFSGLWKQFALGQVAVGALHKAWRLLKDQVGDSIKSAMEAEKANAALDAALTITGRGAAQLGDHFKKYASELMQATIYDDEAIKSTQALLVQLTRLGQDGIDQATRGAIGLASALKMDLSSAANLVAKAMAGNVGVLSRYGIYVKESLPLEEKRSQLLEKLNVLYGRATSETKTFWGQLEQLKNRWGEVQEAAGGFITQQRGVIEILNKSSQAILDYLTMGTMLAEATRSAEEQENRRTEWLGKAAAAAGWHYQEMSKLIEKYGGVTPALLAAINAEKYGVEIKQEYRRVIQEERTAWVALEAARKAAETGTGGGLGDSLGKLTSGLRDSQKAIEAEVSAFRSLGGVMNIVGGEGARAVESLGTMVGGDLGAAIDAVEPKAAGLFEGIVSHAKGAIKEVEDLKFSIQDVYAAAGQIISGFNAVTDQAQRNREIAVDNEYKKKLAAINANVKDEEVRQKAIIALEAEYQIKKTEAQRAGAKASKAVGMMEAMVNTATAVTSALKVFPPWLGIAFASVIGALGAVQIGLISKQPIPLAKGAVFNRPTLLPATTYQVAEAGEKEVVSPVSTIVAAVKQAFAEMSAGPQMAFAGAGATVTNNFSGPLIEAHGWSEAELQRGADKLVDAVNKGLRDIGHRTI